MTKSQVPAALTFGDFFRTRRVSLGLTLRTFSERFGYDPGNISRLERDILSPSIDKQKLKGYAVALKIPKDSEEWVNFFDLAHAAKGKLPEDILKDKRSVKYLPLLFRTARGKKLSKKKLEELVNLINNA
jgi:transcriptional regulator with XRE-family HTH domain